MPDEPPRTPPPTEGETLTLPGRRTGQSWSSLIDEKMRAAQEAGEFDNLSIAGRPLALDENPYAKDRTLEFHILHSNQMAPREISLGKEADQDLSRAEQLLDELRHRRDVIGRRHFVTARDRRIYNALVAKTAGRYEALLQGMRSKILSLNIIAPAALHRPPLDVAARMHAFHDAFPPMDVEKEVAIEQDSGPVNGPAVGVDLGFLRLATLSDDTRFENQRPLRRLLGAVRYLCQQLARRQKGSKNREQTKRHLARLYHRIAAMREDSHHKISYYLAEHYGFIGLEDLNVRGMLKNHKRALSAADAALGKLARYIQTKAGAHGTVVQWVSRWFPSTKRCHQCHHEREITEAERIYICFNPACGWVGDRDLNAALNILDEALHLAGVA